MAKPSSIKIRLNSTADTGFFYVTKKNNKTINQKNLEKKLYTQNMPNPDILIRTGGHQRLSNFMLWQLAYTELYISPVFWPDFHREHLFEAVLDFQRRERRFGRVGAGIEAS